MMSAEIKTLGNVIATANINIILHHEVFLFYGYPLHKDLMIVTETLSA